MQISKYLRPFLDMTFIKYAVIGVSGVVIDFILYTILVNLGLSPVIASVLSVSAGIVNNFFLNAYFNFRKTSSLGRRFISFYLIGFTGVIMSVLFIYVLHNIFGFDPIVAKLVSVLPIIIFQFLFNKSISFSENPYQIPWKALALFLTAMITFSIFIFNAPYYDFTDEADNLLGGQFIASNNGTLYIDYFSHHMPLTYFVSALLFFIIGTKLIAIKVAFGVAMALWILSMSRHLYKAFGLIAFIAFTLLVALTQTLSWSHMILGETLAAFAIAHALILFITSNKRSPSWPDIISYSLLASIVVLSVLSYLPIALLLYSMGLWVLYKYELGQKRLFSITNVGKILLTLSVYVLPYIFVMGYFVLTHSLSEFREQAINFNTLYYSQFTSDAPISKLDAALSIVQGITQSLYSVVTFQPNVKSPIIAALFCLVVILSLTVLYRSKLIIVSVVTSIILLLSSSRGGATTLFSNSDTVRSSIVLSIVGILVIAIALMMLSKREIKKDIVKRWFGVSAFLFIILISLSSISLMSTIGREYVKGKATVDTKLEPGSPATVINLVNSPDDYYWIGPIDFSSQIKTNSQFASNHRFYAPWHAACGSCTTDLLGDLETNKPTIIAFSKDVSIWGHKPKDYAPQLMAFLDSNYYKLSDPALSNFYFRNEKASSINKALGAKGYEISEK